MSTDDTASKSDVPKTGDPQKGRRRVLGGLLGAAVAASTAVFSSSKKDTANTMWLRPPGAKSEAEFASACARCFKCGSACPNGCISYHGLRDGFDLAFTPYIKPRTSGCILCGACADVCPTEALTPFGTEREDWMANVTMGKAKVNEDLCYSFHGRTCGACYRACPLAGKAIKIGVFETPHIQYDHCVGCGLCEQSCLHLPQAIRVMPDRFIVAQTELDELDDQRAQAAAAKAAG